MANATALGMKSLAVHMEEDGATNDAIEVAFTAVQGVRPKDESDVDYRESQPNLISFKDLNIHQLSMQQATTTHLVDFIQEGIPDVIDFDSISKLMKASEYYKLPEPFKPLKDVNFSYTMNLAIWKEDEKWLMIKYFTLFKKQSPTTLRDFLAQGTMLCIDGGGLLFI